MPKFYSAIVFLVNYWCIKVPDHAWSFSESMSPQRMHADIEGRISCISLYLLLVCNMEISACFGVLVRSALVQANGKR